jgi:hypothetical protein
MGKTTLVCVFLVFAILLEDGSSMRKRTEEEIEEDAEIAAAVNRTLAEEAAKKEEEEKKKKNEGEAKIKKAGELEKERKGKGEALPCYNLTCPVVEPCLPCKECPVVEPCPDCPSEKECPEVKRCGPCPGVTPCEPCEPCPVVNTTVGQPTTVTCPEVTGMPTAVAMAIGAVASLSITGLAAIIGLVLRYVPPFVSGFLFLATIVILWYLCSQYPETARELGGRAWTALQEATVALGHRVMEAVRHHQEQVSVPIKLNLFFLNEFHVLRKSLH